MSETKTDFQRGCEDGKEGREVSDSSSKEYTLGYKRGKEEKEDLDKLTVSADLKSDPNFRRGFRNGKDGCPLSDLSSRYVEGYELGRRKYLDDREADREEARRMGWDRRRS